MKNTQNGIHSSLDIAEKMIRGFEDREKENLKWKVLLWDLGQFQSGLIYESTGTLERGGGGDIKISEEIITKTGSNLMKTTQTGSPCKAQQTSSPRNWSKTVLKRIIIKLLKMNGKRKSAREKTFHMQRNKAKETISHQKQSKQEDKLGSNIFRYEKIKPLEFYI